SGAASGNGGFQGEAVDAGSAFGGDVGGGGLVAGADEPELEEFLEVALDGPLRLAGVGREGGDGGVRVAASLVGVVGQAEQRAEELRWHGRCVLERPHGGFEAQRSFSRVVLVRGLR